MGKSTGSAVGLPSPKSVNTSSSNDCSQRQPRDAVTNPTLPFLLSPLASCSLQRRRGRGGDSRVRVSGDSAGGCRDHAPQDHVSERWICNSLLCYAAPQHQSICSCPGALDSTWSSWPGDGLRSPSQQPLAGSLANLQYPP